MPPRRATLLDMVKLPSKEELREMAAAGQRAREKHGEQAAAQTAVEHDAEVRMYAQRHVRDRQGALHALPWLLKEALAQGYRGVAILKYSAVRQKAPHRDETLQVVDQLRESIEQENPGYEVYSWTSTHIKNAAEQQLQSGEYGVSRPGVRHTLVPTYMPANVPVSAGSDDDPNAYGYVIVKFPME